MKLAPRPRSLPLALPFHLVPAFRRPVLPLKERPYLPVHQPLTYTFPSQQGGIPWACFVPVVGMTECHLSPAISSASALFPSQQGGTPNAPSAVSQSFRGATRPGLRRPSVAPALDRFRDPLIAGLAPAEPGSLGCRELGTGRQPAGTFPEPLSYLSASPGFGHKNRVHLHLPEEC